MFDADEIPETSRTVRRLGWAGLPPEELVRRSLERVEEAVAAAVGELAEYRKRIAAIKAEDEKDKTALGG